MDAPQNDAPTLRIVKAVRPPSVISSYQLLFVMAVCLLMPIVPMYLSEREIHMAEDTRDLVSGLREHYTRPPGRFQSSWFEHSWVTNGTTRTERWLVFSDPVMNDVFKLITIGQLLSNDFVGVAMCLLKTAVDLFLCVNYAFFHRYGRKGSVLLLIFCACFAFLLLCSIDGFWCKLYAWLKEILAAMWIDNSVVEVQSHLKGRHIIRETMEHPFTFGTQPPFYLTHLFRYHKEDVIFNCEYKVYGDEIATSAISKTSWWNKEGRPVEPSDRIFVNVTILPNFNDDDKLQEGYLKQFTIRSTLTILLIQEEDFGYYSCNYFNPMKVKIRMPQFSAFGKTEQKTPGYSNTPPMSPHPKCDCQPRKEFIQSGFSQEPQSFHKDCFAEFELRKYNTAANQTIDYVMNPGGILIDVTDYITTADDDDILIDVSSETEEVGNRRFKCCSLTIWLYWFLFRDGSLMLRLPVSRNLKQDHDLLQIVSWSCMCKSSYGLRTSKFGRIYYNSSTRETETIDVEHPVKLHLKPALFSFSDTSEDDSHLKSKILDIAEYFEYPFNLDMILLMLLIVFSLYFYRLIRWCTRECVVPVKHTLQGLTGRETLFNAIAGTKILPKRNAQIEAKFDVPCGKYEKTFDVYLAYADDEVFDRHVAQYFKNILLELNLTVFDPLTDVSYGMITMNECIQSIQRSGRFIAVISQSYVCDPLKLLEFGAIQDTIISQNSAPKNRLLVVNLDDAQVKGLRRVASIARPRWLTETMCLDELTVRDFLAWELQTRPLMKDISAASALGVCLNLSHVRSVILLLVMLYLACFSTIIRTINL